MKTGSIDREELKAVVKEILMEDRNLLKEVVKELVSEKPPDSNPTDQVREEKINASIDENFIRYDEVFKALA
ncbi:MAG: hypothetical protein WBA17_04720 [Saprospiraceae bacterium]